MPTIKPLPLHELINFLFEYVLKPDGKPYSNSEVADAIGISRPSITLIRQGQQENPTLNTVRAILNFFAVPSAYLDVKSREEAINILLSEQEEITFNLRLRNLKGSELSPRLLKQVKAVAQYAIDLYQAQEYGLPEPELPNFPSLEEEMDDVPK